MLSRRLFTSPMHRRCFQDVFTILSRCYKRVGAAVLPSPCNNEVAGSSPGSAALCAFGFQSMLASAGFSPGTPAFLLHSKLTLDSDSLSKISFMVSLLGTLGTMYQVGFPWRKPNQVSFILSIRSASGMHRRCWWDHRLRYKLIGDHRWGKTQQNMSSGPHI